MRDMTVPVRGRRDADSAKTGRQVQRLAVIASMGVLLCSCSPGERSDANTNRKLEGYGGLVLGSSFEEAMSVAPPSNFNAYGLKECIEDMPMRGCFLSPG